MDRSSVALRILKQSADRVGEWWPALMMRLHDKDKSQFLESLMAARLFANAAMDSRTWKTWRDQTRHFQHVRGIELKRVARVFRNQLPPQGRAAYVKSLHVMRAAQRKRRASKRNLKG
jgi:hypothetical protein